MKPISFVPTVWEIPAGEAGAVPGLEAVISYWTEGSCTAADWFGELHEHWGNAGLALRRGDDTLGFLVYGPPEYLPRAGRYPVGPLDEGAVLLAYVGGDPRTRRQLLVRMLRDLRSRDVGSVEAIASDVGLPRHVSTRFLMESGWQPVRTGLYLGLPYTLARTELGSAVEVGELARGILGKVKLPSLKAPSPVPGVFTRTVYASESAVASVESSLRVRLRVAGSRS